MATLALTGAAGAGFSGFAGTVAGGLFGALVQRVFGGKQEAPEPTLPDLSVQSSTYGAPLPNAWGTNRLAGNLMWERDIIVEEEEIELGKGGSGAEGILHHFYGTFSVAFVLGPIDGSGVKGFRRVWADSLLLLDLADDTTPENVAAHEDLAESIVFQPGNQTQEASALQEAFEGAGEVPGYRGVCYMDVERLDLQSFSNRIPSMTAEISITGTESYLILPAWPTRPPADENRNINYQNGVHFFGESAILQGTSITLKRQRWTLGGEKLTETEHVYTAPVHGLLGIFAYVMNTALLDEDKVYAHGPRQAIYGFWEDTTFLGETEDTAGVAPVIMDICKYSDIHGAIYGIRYGPQGHKIFRFAAVPASAPDTGELAITLKATHELSTGTHDVEGIHPDPTDAGRVWALIETSSGNDEVWLLDNELTVTTVFDTGGQPITQKSGFLYDPHSQRAMIGGGSTGFFIYSIDFDAGTMSLIASGVSTVGGATYEPINLGTSAMLVANQYVSPLLLSQAGVAVADVIGDITALAGMDAGDVDTTGVTESMMGYVLPRPMKANAALGPLVEGFQIDPYESDHKLRFRSRNADPVVFTIPGTELAASEPGAGERPDKLVIDRVQDTELLKQVTVRHRDPAARHEVGAQTYQRIGGQSTATKTLDIPAVLTVQSAMDMAERLTLTDWAERLIVRFSTHIGYVAMDPTDRVTVDGRTGRLVKVDTDWQTLALSCVMVQDETSVWDPNATGDAAPVDDDTVPFVGATILHLLDIANMRDLDDNVAFYWTVGGVFATWPGARLFQSLDAGSSWNNIGALSAGAVMGVAETALAAGPAGFDFKKTDWSGGVPAEPWDAVETVDISVTTQGTLTNASKDEIKGGANTALLGDEIIGYETATSLGGRSWRLSGLLRARRGTQAARNTHAITDRFVVLTTTTVRNYGHGTDEYNKPFLYRAPGFGQMLLSVQQQQFTNTGMRKRPWTVVGFVATRPAVGTGWAITFDWERRSRLGNEYRDFVGDPPPLDAPDERYELELYNAAKTVLYRTETIIGANTFVYSEVMQNTDTGLAGGAVHAKIYQINTEYPSNDGRGGQGSLDFAAFVDGGPTDPTTEPVPGVEAVDELDRVASEALAAGDLVNLHDSGGPRARLADNSAVGKAAHGFVLEAIDSGATGTIHLTGVNNKLSGLTSGTDYYLGLAGAITATRPTATGTIVQRVGVGAGGGEFVFDRGAVVLRV